MTAPGTAGDHQAHDRACAMAIAVNTFVWHSPLTDQLLDERLPLIADWGFDAVELPLENPGAWDPAHARELLAELGLSDHLRELEGSEDRVDPETLTHCRRGLARACCCLLTSQCRIARCLC